MEYNNSKYMIQAGNNMSLYTNMKKQERDYNKNLDDLLNDEDEDIEYFTDDTQPSYLNDIAGSGLDVNTIDIPYQEYTNSTINKSEAKEVMGCSLTDVTPPQTVLVMNESEVNEYLRPSLRLTKQGNKSKQGNISDHAEKYTHLEKFKEHNLSMDFRAVSGKSNIKTEVDPDSFKLTNPAINSDIPSINKTQEVFAEAIVIKKSYDESPKKKKYNDPDNGKQLIKRNKSYEESPKKEKSNEPNKGQQEVKRDPSYKESPKKEKSNEPNNAKQRIKRQPSYEEAPSKENSNKVNKKKQRIKRDPSYEESPKKEKSNEVNKAKQRIKIEKSNGQNKEREIIKKEEIRKDFNRVSGTNDPGKKDDELKEDNEKDIFEEEVMVDGIYHQLYEKQRIVNMVNLRQKLAKENAMEGPYLRPLIYNKKFSNLYSKGLIHDEDGYVNQVDMAVLLNALNERDKIKLEQVHLNAGCKLLNPSAAWANDLIGKSVNTYRYSRIPPLSSDILAANMGELYALSLSRDIPFSQYGSNKLIREYCGYLNELGHYPKGQINPNNIFRIPIESNIRGLYISQFLYREVKFAGFIHKQKYITNADNSNYMKTWDSALKAQNGKITKSIIAPRTQPRYLITGRDLACYAHSCEVYDCFFNTNRILQALKVPLNPALNKSKVEQPYVNLGLPDIEAMLSIIGRNALLAAWYVKWNTMFLRPEALGIEIERITRDSTNRYDISNKLLQNPIMEQLKAKNGNHILSQVYPEGSSLSPSYPSGYVSVVGACVTVLKFFYDCKHEIEIHEPDAEGKELVKTGKKSTVGAELDKLASNLAYSRSWAGCNYWMDLIHAMKKSEQCALSCLSDFIYRYPEHISISIQRFNGKLITIQN